MRNAKKKFNFAKGKGTRRFSPFGGLRPLNPILIKYLKGGVKEEPEVPFGGVKDEPWVPFENMQQTGILKRQGLKP